MTAVKIFTLSLVFLVCGTFFSVLFLEDGKVQDNVEMLIFDMIPVKILTDVKTKIVVPVFVNYGYCL